MASNSKSAILKRVSGPPGRGVGVNVAAGTSDVLVPEFPRLPSRLTDDSVRQFGADVDRWRSNLQAQFPIPQSKSSASDDVEALVKAAVAEAVKGISVQSSTTVLDPRVDDILKILDGLTTTAPTPTPTSSRYIHTQGTPSATWTITHSLGCYPSCTVVDSAGSVFVGDVRYVSENQMVVSFAGPFSGKAYVN